MKNTAAIVLTTWFAGALLATEPTAPGKIVQSGPLRFEEHLIKDGYTYAYGIAAADLDGDGDLDLTSADCTSNNALYWFENDGRGGFKQHFIQKDDPERLERHEIGDIDRDGRPDVVIVKNCVGDLLWFRNSGTPTDGKLWKRIVITHRKLPGAYDVTLADFDADGDLDVAASSWRFGNKFAWFENDGTPAEGEWKMHLIEDGVSETRMIRAADIDGDGDPDLVGTARVQPLVVWYENTRKSAAVLWKKHVIDAKTVQPVHGQPVDIDQDGDLDVLLALGMSFSGKPETEQIVWYENSGTPADGGWKKHVVHRGFHGAFEAVAADLDGDKDLDVVATAWGVPGQVAWLENNGNPRGHWTLHLIKEKWLRANQVITADLDGDGRLDIVACAERDALELRWWRNLGPSR